MFEKFFDSFYEPFGFVGFYEIAIGTGIHRDIDVLPLSNSGCEDYRRARTAPAYTLAKVDAVTIGKPIVENVKIEVALGDFFFGGGDCVDRDEIEILHDEFEDFARIVVIFDTQHPSVG